jgi:hypothetical protein
MNAAHWSHFLAANRSNEEEEQARQDYSLESSRYNQAMSSSAQASVFEGSMSVLNDSSSKSSFESSAPRPPRRNLTEQFEELYVDSDTPSTKQEDCKLIDVSPTAVTEVVVTSDSESRDTPDTASNVHVSLSHDDDDDDELPRFQLDKSLQRDLSQALVNRVSFYGVIHDVNKEANSMATSDTSSFARSCNTEDLADEEMSPLVVAVNGTPSRPSSRSSKSTMNDAAVIDEEKWLLAAIESRQDSSRSIAACPPTFLQAMGEREYDNPLSSMETSRTQLWKPCRSWWEAKSGKNPWIEPTSHNKRWRYLWPLIHYHKFLAKCIKKLKRNGVDVKTSVSPVAVFLREEVCAVSDHLASVSLFTSEEWMDCLVHFNGWTDHSPVAEKRLRDLISKLSLRPLDEPGDVDSPLLRSQVDEHFLRAMASAREQMTNGGIQQERANLHKSVAQLSGSNGSKHGRNHKMPLAGGRNKIPLHPQRVTPMAPPHSSAAIPADPPYGKGPAGTPQQPYHYSGGQWWTGGWPQYAYCDENGSVQSALSGDSYPLHYNEYGIYTPEGYYGPPPQDRLDYYYGQGAYPPPPGMTPDQYQGCWMPHPPSGDPNSTFDPQGPQGSGYVPGTPSNHSSPHRNYNPYQFSPAHTRATPHQTPHKSPYPPSSPYWGHLDQSTLAMTGLVTPHKVPETPERPTRPPDGDEDAQEKAEEESPADKTDEDIGANAKPLLINNWSQQYYPHGSYGAREGWVPPSPATQFMMSPQASSQAAAYYSQSYNGGPYGFSPHRHSWRQPHHPSSSPGVTRKLNQTPVKQQPESSSEIVTPPPAVRKVTENGRDSPVTAETMAESESIVDS